MSTLLLNNLSANDDPVEVSIADIVGAGDGPGGSLSIDSETLAVIAGAGSQRLLCNRGSSPAAHAVGATVDYTSPTLPASLGLSQITAVNANPGSTMFSEAAGAPGGTLTTFLYFDTTASTGGLYAWDGSAYQKVGLATS